MLGVGDLSYGEEQTEGCNDRAQGCHREVSGDLFLIFLSGGESRNVLQRRAALVLLQSISRSQAERLLSLEKAPSIVARFVRKDCQEMFFVGCAEFRAAGSFR